MTDLRKAAEQALEALERCPALYKAPEAAQALRQALSQPEQEPVEYKEECWACGCEECICATKVPGYYESKIKEAVLAEREACAKVVEEQWGRWAIPVNKDEYNEMWDECAAAIRARSEK